MKYYNIYDNGTHVLLFDTDKFEIISAFRKDIIHEGKEFEELGKYDNGKFTGFEKKDDLIKVIREFVTKLSYDSEKGSYLVTYPNGEWDMYDNFDGVYTKYEVRDNLIVFKQINSLPKDYHVNHWNGKDWLDTINQYLCV